MTGRSAAQMRAAAHAQQDTDRENLGALRRYASLTGMDPDTALERWTRDAVVTAPIKGFAVLEVPDGGRLVESAVARLRRKDTALGPAFTAMTDTGEVRTWFLVEPVPVPPVREPRSYVLRTAGRTPLLSPFGTPTNWRWLIKPRSQTLTDLRDLAQVLYEAHRALRHEGLR